MKGFLQRLPISTKFIFIAAIPVILLIYSSFLIYQEKTQKINLIFDNMTLVNESVAIHKLISSLSVERRLSFRYLEKKEPQEALLVQQQITDSLISLLAFTQKGHLAYFKQYTFLDDLHELRAGLDSNSTDRVKHVIQYFNEVVYRLNNINTANPPEGLFAPEIDTDFATQKILNDIITYLSIIRTDVYTALYNKDFDFSTDPGMLSMYSLFKSYEREFYLKSSAKSIRSYDSLKTNRKLLIFDYIDSLFKTSPVHPSLSPDYWWDQTSNELKDIRHLQQKFSNKVFSEMNLVHKKEIAKRRNAMIFLALAILIVAILLGIFALSMIRSLQSLSLAAGQISKGVTGIELTDVPKGVIRSLADSILEIQRHNLVLAEAANEIGKGNFAVTVTPRSDKDLLGRSIKKMKQDLREFNQQKDRIQKETMALVHKRDEFFSMSSHEFKTPITSLKAYTQLLLMDEAIRGEAASLEMLLKMESQINKLINLINDLLDTSKLESDNLSYNFQPVKLNNLISEEIREISQNNKDYKIIFQKNVNATVLGDRDRLSQVIRNLILNAIKYSNESRDIIIRLDKSEDKVTFSIKDFGYGIPEDEQDKIFERFYRIAGQNLHTYPGLGLGLYLAYHIIKKHSGHIWLESEYTKGSTFYFDLPTINA